MTVGDVVRLKSGSPNMVVTGRFEGKVGEVLGMCRCLFYAAERMNEVLVPEAALKLEIEERAVTGTAAQQLMYDAIVECFDDCQGLVRHSTEESDNYWELAEHLMKTYGESTGQPVLRKVEKVKEDD